MKFTIVKSDIQKGKKGCTEFCPIALCVKRKTHRKVAVDDTKIRIYRTSNGWYDVPVQSRTYINPKTVVKFIEQFDAGKPVKPFTFELI